MNTHSYSGDVINPSNKTAEPGSLTALTFEAFDIKNIIYYQKQNISKKPTTPLANEDDYEASISYEEDY